jgi:hypothetical protein
MMRQEILFLIFSIGLLSQAQTKPSLLETQTWIKETIESYPRRTYNAAKSREEFVRAVVSFENCKMIIEEIPEYGLHGSKITIPLNKISVPVFNETPARDPKYNIELAFKITSGEKSMVSEITDGTGWKAPTQKINQTSLLLFRDCVSKKVPERLQKAFENLINYCGGTAHTETKK